MKENILRGKTFKVVGTNSINKNSIFCLLKNKGSLKPFSINVLGQRTWQEAAKGFSLFLLSGKSPYPWCWHWNPSLGEPWRFQSSNYVGFSSPINPHIVTYNSQYTNHNPCRSTSAGPWTGQPWLQLPGSLTHHHSLYHHQTIIQWYENRKNNIFELRSCNVEDLAL